MALLEVQKLCIQFGGLRACNDVALHVDRGEIVGLIGPNGAGKTTVFNMLTGVYRPTGGTIRFKDRSIVGLKPYQITHLGVARTFQNIRLFNQLSVLENVKIARHHLTPYTVLDAVLRTGRYADGERAIHEKAMSLLEIMGLSALKDEIARNLPYGQQRRLEIARALATEPELLLLDEPAAGMNPQETTQLMNLIRWIRDEFKLTILLIEHDMHLVMNVCERIYVLNYGELIAHGSPAEIKSNPQVIEAYLGQEVS